MKFKVQSSMFKSLWRIALRQLNFQLDGFVLQL
jgi:hypothetical protein